MARPSPCGGFTLLELLISVGIVGVLASLTLPSMSLVLHKARRTEARAALLAIQHAQERHYLDHLRYADELPPTAGSGGSRAGAPGDYTFRIETSRDGQHYVASATVSPQGRQRNDRPCQVFQVDALGRQRAFDADGRPTAERCW